MDNLRLFSNKVQKHFSVPKNTESLVKQVNRIIDKYEAELDKLSRNTYISNAYYWTELINAIKALEDRGENLLMKSASIKSDSDKLTSLMSAIQRNLWILNEIVGLSGELADKQGTLFLASYSVTQSKAIYKFELSYNSDDIAYVDTIKSNFETLGWKVNNDESKGKLTVDIK